MAIQGSTLQNPRVVSREQWVAERVAFLTKEKAFTRLRDDLSRQRRELPWVRVEKPYVFHGPKGDETLAELFEGRSQLLVYHFMLGPEMKEGCRGCSLVADHFDATLPHLAARDVTLVVVSRAPLPQITLFKRRMGWRFKWVSSYGSDFNYDFHATVDEAVAPVEYNYRDKTALLQLGQTYHVQGEQPGASVFVREGDHVYQTYSTYGRGVEALMGTYSYLDLVPKGRDEDGLDVTMSWVRHHDRYED